MTHLFDPYHLEDLKNSLSDSLIAEYVKNIEEARQTCIKNGCDHGVVHCERDLRQLSEDPLQYHIDLHKHYIALQAKHYNDLFSIN